MIRAFWCCCAAVAFGAVSLCANNQYFCNAGAQPDAFIDFSKLPTSPSGYANFSATIPVTGAPGLTATIVFQGISPNRIGPQGPLYTVNGDTILDVHGPAGLVAIQFNYPIQGVRLELGTSGRFQHSFEVDLSRTIKTPPTSIVPPTISSISNGLEEPSAGQDTRSPFSLRSDAQDILQATINVNTDPAEHGDFTINNVRIETGDYDPSSVVTKAGLIEWLRADRGVDVIGYPFNPPISAWHDQSGNGNDAVPVQGDSVSSSASLSVQTGPSCRGAVVGPMKTHVRINGTPDLTVFVVTQNFNDRFGTADPSQYSALYWTALQNGSPAWINPAQSRLVSQFGSGKTDPITVRRNPVIGGDMNLTTFVHNGSTERLFVNGTLVSKDTNRNSVISGNSGELLIGSGSGGTAFPGGVAEVLVYDRVLTGKERNAITLYLLSKYGIE